MQKHRLWLRVLMLIVIAIFGFIYAIPNLYSEDPAVQISATDSISVQSLQEQVVTILQQQQIPYRAIKQHNEQIDVLFFSTDKQLLARDLIKQALGSHYVVALNLLAATPQWLRVLGASPMKQGLDLRGGVHFLLEVDVHSVVIRRLDNLLKLLRTDLRHSKIRYLWMRKTQNNEIQLALRTQEDLSNAQQLLETWKSNVLVHAVSNKQLVLSLATIELSQIQRGVIEQTMTILRNRVNELGIGEAIVQQQGSTRIAVDLPGIQDAARAKQILGGTATLEFHLVDAKHDANIAQETGVIPISSKLYYMDEQPLLLKRQVVLSGDAIISAMSSFDQQSASPAVQVELGGGREALFAHITETNIGKRMAIVYVESKPVFHTVHGKQQMMVHRDERVISAPVIQSALGSNFQITGMSNVKEASNLALLLRAGALPTVIYPIEERTVGPSLGKENIRRGLVSLEVGMGMILIVMLLYYRIFGLMANIGLFLNLIFLSALMSIFGATLTLPGIAGFVLTIGMAVDANVLIYERIREELRQRMAPRTAIHAGYERAFATILDANVTTFIVGLILFNIGTGPIKGFAIILCLGLLTSMLTSITYTRVMVDCWYGRNKPIKQLSIGL